MAYPLGCHRKIEVISFINSSMASGRPLGVEKVVKELKEGFGTFIVGWRYLPLDVACAFACNP